MKFYIYTLFLALFFLIKPTVKAQITTTISGTVQDQKTKEMLYPATIRLLGRDGGCLTEVDGSFKLIVEGNIDSFSCSYLGYATEVFKVKKGKINDFKIKLKETDNKLQVATVEGKKGKMSKDTFAMKLWRNVVENRKENAALVSPFMHYNSYEKAQINVDQFHRISKLRPFKKTLNFMLKYAVRNEYESYLPAMLSERVSDIYMQKDPSQTQRVTFLGQALGIPLSDISESLHGEIDKFDIYANSTKIIGKQITLPFSAISNGLYKYFVTDSLEKENRKFYKLEFMGKNPQEVAFAGHAWIEDSTFAIHDLQMNLPRSANINFVSNYKIEQAFERQSDGTLLQTTESGQRTISIFKPKKREPFGISIHNNSLNYNVDFPAFIEDSIFTKNGITYKENYFNEELTDSEALAKERPSPLKEQETKINLMTLELVMNIMNKKNAFNTFYKIGKAAYTGYIPFKHFEVGKLSEVFSYNSVEGGRFKLSVRSNYILKKKIQLSAYGAYGTKDELFKGGANINWKLDPSCKNGIILSAGFSDDYVFPTSFDQRNYQRFTYSLFIQHPSILNKKMKDYPLEQLFKVRNFYLKYHQTLHEGLSLSGKLSHQIYYGEAYTGFTFENQDGSIDKMQVNQAQINLYFGPKKVWYAKFFPVENSAWNSKKPSVDFYYTFNHIMNLNGKEYLSHKFDAIIKYSVTSLLGETNMRVNLTKTFGDIAYPLMSLHAGNPSNFIQSLSYNAMQNGEFVSDASAGFLIEHHFKGFIFNKLPLIRKLKFREIVFFRGLWGDVKASNLDLMQLPQGMYIPKNYQEVGFGISNIAKILRVDFIWRLRHLENLQAQKFGIKLGVQIDF